MVTHPKGQKGWHGPGAKARAGEGAVLCAGVLVAASVVTIIRPSPLASFQQLSVQMRQGLFPAAGSPCWYQCGE